MPHHVSTHFYAVLLLFQKCVSTDVAILKAAGSDRRNGLRTVSAGRTDNASQLHDSSEIKR